MAASIKSVALPADPPLSKIAAELADTPPLRDALQWFVRQKQWINEQHLQLCRADRVAAAVLEPGDHHAGYGRHAASVGELLRYPADTAGGIMTNAMVLVTVDLDMAGARRSIRPDLANPDFVYYVYVVDNLDSRRLQGVLTLRDLLLKDDHELVRDAMQQAVVTLDPLMPAIAAGRAVAEQHFAALPVVGHDGRLLGTVTADAALMQIASPALGSDTPRVFT